MYKMSILLLTILIVNFCYAEELEENNIDKDIINHDWKLNVISLGHGMIPLGQFENKKPIKALSLMVMKHYWLNEYRSAKTNDDISDRNRSFWWLLFLNFYGIVDSYVDYHLKNFPDDSLKNDNKESN